MNSALKDLFRPRLIVSSKVFQVAFFHLDNNSALFSASCSFFTLVTCRSQFDLYLLSFSSTGSIFNVSKMSSFLLWSKKDVTVRTISGKSHWKRPQSTTSIRWQLLLVAKFLPSLLKAECTIKAASLNTYSTSRCKAENQVYGGRVQLNDGVYMHLHGAENAQPRKTKF